MKDRQGRPAESEQLLKQAQAIMPRHPDVLNLLGVLCLRSNRVDEGIALLKKAVKAAPKIALFHFNLGNAFQIAREFNHARSAFIKAVNLDANMAAAHKNLGVVLSELGQHQAAEEFFAKAVKLQPDDLEAKLNHANALLQLGHKQQALTQMQQLVDESENIPPTVWQNLGLSFLAVGNDIKAEVSFRKAVEHLPENGDAWMGLGHALSNLRMAEEAVAAFDRAAELGMNPLRAHYFSADALFESGDHDKARQILNDLLRENADDTEVLLKIARTDGRLGDFVSQEEKIRKVLEIEANNVSAYALLAQIPGRQLSELEIKRIRKLAGNNSLDNSARSQLSFALGDFLHQQKDYNQAFKYYEQANELKGFVFDKKAYESFITELIETFSTKFFDERVSWGSGSMMPVLIVGTPRSGTTLTEQILSAHPSVAGAGERGTVTHLASDADHDIRQLVKKPSDILLSSQNDVHHFTENYLAAMRPYARQGETMVTNKLPGNFLWLGLFALMFPNAPIIHTRRDPRDSLLSIYFKNFEAAHNYAYNLKDLGFWYRQYERLMQHWEAVLPNPYLAIDYEDMVTDQEAMTHKVLEFLGLEWDERVLEYYKQKSYVKTASLWQVRQPVYTTSVARWKPYEKQLQPLFDAIKIS